jgi:hypothetical protein
MAVAPAELQRAAKGVADSKAYKGAAGAVRNITHNIALSYL